MLGRCATVRRGYSTLRSLSGAVAAAAPLRIGDLYEEATAAKPIEGQVADLRERSYLIGPHIAPGIAVDLQRQCRTLPLKVAGRDAGTYEELVGGPSATTRSPSPR